MAAKSIPVSTKSKISSALSLWFLLNMRRNIKGIRLIRKYSTKAITLPVGDDNESIRKT
jgi:hypothetical protein